MVATADGGAYVVGAIGSTDEASARRDVFLARIGPDGALDASFGTAGLVTTDFGGEDEAEAVEQLPDGRLLVVGTSDRTDQLETDVLVARYHPDGRSDHSLGGDGRATLTAEALRTDCARATSVAADSHGRILVAGGLGCGGEGGEGLRGLLTRLRPNGRLDRSFSRLGLDHVCSVDDMAVRRNDRIVLIGDQTSAGQNDAYCEEDITGTVLGLRANGELDRTFGVRAQTKLRIPGTVGNTAHAVHVDRRERVLVAVGADISAERSRPAVVP